MQRSGRPILALTSADSHFMVILMTLILAFFFIGQKAMSAAHVARVTAEYQGLRLWCGRQHEADRFEGKGGWRAAMFGGLDELLPDRLWS